MNLKYKKCLFCHRDESGSCIPGYEMELLMTGDCSGFEHLIFSKENIARQEACRLKEEAIKQKGGGK